MYLGTMWWIVLVIFATAVVVSILTFLLQWGGCCVQRTDHTGTHLRVQLGWGYAFDMHPGRRMLDESRRHRMEATQRALATQPRGLPVPVLARLPSFTFTSTDKHAPEDVDCTICQEDMCQEKVASLPCGHMFHKKCIKTWLRRRATCPTCRLEITAKMLENDVVIGATPEAPVLHDIETGLSTHPEQPAVQGNMQRNDDSMNVVTQPAIEAQNAQQLGTEPMQSLTVSQDRVTSLPATGHIVQQHQTIASN